MHHAWRRWVPVGPLDSCLAQCCRLYLVTPKATCQALLQALNRRFSTTRCPRSCTVYSFNAVYLLKLLCLAFGSHPPWPQRPEREHGHLHFFLKRYLSCSAFWQSTLPWTGPLWPRTPGTVIDCQGWTSTAQIIYQGVKRTSFIWSQT